LGDSPGED
jgi:calcium/calmodulin-dependent protein kinase kinase 2